MDFLYLSLAQVLSHSILHLINTNMKVKYISFLLGLLLMGFFSVKGVSQNQRNGNNSVLHNPPQVDFSWLNACLGDTTKFTNGSIRANTYTWTVYNKTMTKLDSSNSVNYSYYFPVADTFYVKLQADNGHLVSITEMIVIGTVTTADFNFMHCSNQFMNHSTCATSCFWDFGDGAISSANTPTHQYADTGYYNVKLVVSNGIFKDSMTKQIFVDVDRFPSGITTWYVGHDTVFVHAVDSMSGMFYNWNFGGGIHMYKRDTFYVYPATGTYYIYFSDWNTCSTAYATDTIYVVQTGIKSNEGVNFSSITVFPNPVKSSEAFNVLFNASVEIHPHLTIYNSIGEKISENYYKVVDDNNTRLKINLGVLPNGVYSMSIDGNGISSHSKFIIAND
jgi:hypothetical protein